MDSMRFLWGCLKICLTKFSDKNIQLHAKEIIFLYKALWDRPSCRMLVFGIGHDSILWYSLNKKGKTVFIEDDPEWFSKIKKEHPLLEAYLVEFSTKVSYWKESIERPEKLALDLPPKIEKDTWDVILIDGPSGYNNESPGRASCIYMSSKLIAAGGDIFVHDCERPLESKCCEIFFGKDNLKAEIKGRALLRHYRYQNS